MYVCVRGEGKHILGKVHCIAGTVCVCEKRGDGGRDIDCLNGNYFL